MEIPSNFFTATARHGTREFRCRVTAQHGTAQIFHRRAAARHGTARHDEFKEIIRFLGTGFSPQDESEAVEKVKAFNFIFDPARRNLKSSFDFSIQLTAFFLC